MSYISTAMSSALSTSSSTTPSSPFSDVRFGKVYEALVLVLQGLLRVGLAERETQDTQIESLAGGDGAGEEGPGRHLDEGVWSLHQTFGG